MIVLGEVVREVLHVCRKEQLSRSVTWAMPAHFCPGDRTTISYATQYNDDQSRSQDHLGRSTSIRGVAREIRVTARGEKSPATSSELKRLASEQRINDPSTRRGNVLLTLF